VQSRRLALQGENIPVQDRERPEVDEKNKLKNGLAYKVPSFTIDMRAMSPLHECALIGEGTFGKCLSGKYQNLPVAVKVFKGNQSVKSIHHEASILLQVPGHPNIAMLLGVQTVQYPFLLLSRLCLSDGIPMTYSKYLHHLERTAAHLKICLHLMYEIAEGLNHIHCHSILHNDLKGNNIVVEGSKEVQHAILIDFGKAGMPQIKGMVYYFRIVVNLFNTQCVNMKLLRDCKQVILKQEES
jgi:serine/threonine protein kinase